MIARRWSLVAVALSASACGGAVDLASIAAQVSTPAPTASPSTGDAPQGPAQLVPDYSPGPTGTRIGADAPVLAQASAPAGSAAPGDSPAAAENAAPAVVTPSSSTNTSPAARTPAEPPAPATPPTVTAAPVEASPAPVTAAPAVEASPAPATAAREDPAPTKSSGQWYRGDGSAMPSFGGWAGSPPAEAAARAGFDWFETGYPGDSGCNEVLRSGGVRPFAYINLGELHDSLAGQARYDGPYLRTSEVSWALHLVDVTSASWQDWLVRRAEQAYASGSRGIKWDVPPDVPPGKTRGDVNDATASVMRRILDAHPDMKFILNQMFDFALAYPHLVDAVETEGLFSARSSSGAWLQPWKDPWWWGPQFEKARALRDMGKAIIVAEYADPWGGEARQLHDAIVAQGFVPYITNSSWDARGRGLNVNPGW